jgi:hypothetical protein
MKDRDKWNNCSKKEWMTCCAVSWMTVEILVKIQRNTSQMKKQSEIRHEKNVENVRFILAQSHIDSKSKRLKNFFFL